MSLNPLINQAISKGLIAFDDYKKTVTYIKQNKRLRWSDPEERVRARSYASLVLEYGFAADNIDIEVAVEHRVPNT